MTEIYLHDQKLDNIFELLGTDEDDITYSIGWVLSQSSSFLKLFLSEVFPRKKSLPEVEYIRLQKSEKEKGRTDIEIVGTKLHIIIEAKRGWCFPKQTQMKKYIDRLKQSETKDAILIVMSESSGVYARENLPSEIDGIKVMHLGWQQIAHLIRNISCKRNHEKRLLRQLYRYFERIVKMQNQDSNMVYVVSLGKGKAKWCKLTWYEFMLQKLKYFHPFGGNGWPKVPPNYIAFRYNGQLQSIHHIDGCQIVDGLYKVFPEEISKYKCDHKHLVYDLGPAIRPTKKIKTGNIFPNGRVWAMLDLLLTCNTISEARDKTKKRLAEN